MDDNINNIIIKSNLNTNINTLDMALFDQKTFNNNIEYPYNQNKNLINGNNKSY